MNPPFQGGACSRPKYRLAPHSENGLKPATMIPLGPQHAVGLAQHQVGVVGELERVLHHDEVDRVLAERKRVRVGEELGRGIVVERPPRRDPALRERRLLGQPDLERVATEDVGDGLVEVRLLALGEVAPERRREPLGERR